MVNFITVLMSCLIMVSACGKGVSENGNSETSATSSATAPQNVADGGDVDSVEFRGFIVSAFTVTVDGTGYQDMEDFYTSEVERLADKVKAAGYDASYIATFDAQIGFKDLYNGMDVYIAATSAAGYLGQTTVQGNGQFLVTLPKDATLDSYKVRANKRINIILQKGDEQQKICYNFSAMEQSVQLTEQSKPIIIDNFVSRLTKYACESINSSSSGITIPQIATPAARGKITKGMSKADTLAVMGSDHLIIESDHKWCWFSGEVAAHPNCSVNYAASCQCSVDFDDAGVLSAQDNIKADLLDILSF